MHVRTRENSVAQQARHAVGGALLVGVLALSACGTDDNSAAGVTGPAPDPTVRAQCAPGTLNASGSTAQANAMSQWVKAYQSACPGVTVNYQANGSGAGIQQFLQGNTTFAGSDSALTPGERATAQQRCEGDEAVHLPMVVGPIAVVYNVPGVSDLRLSPTTLARVFAGDITAWDDPAITADNEGHTLPGAPIQAFHRSDSSGTTDNFTAYLAGAAAKAWTYAHDKIWKASGGQGAKGSDGVAAAVQRTSGSIGYVELSYAQHADLAMASVQNASGRYVALTGATAAATVAEAKVVGTGNDLELALDYNTKAEQAYPIVLVTYEITCAEGLPADQVKLAKGFLSYAASAQGQRSLGELGYAPLPEQVAAKVRQSVRALS